MNTVEIMPPVDRSSCIPYTVKIHQQITQLHHGTILPSQRAMWSSDSRTVDPVWRRSRLAPASNLVDSLTPAEMLGSARPHSAGQPYFSPLARPTRRNAPHEGGRRHPAKHATRELEDLREGNMAPSERARQVMTAARMDPAAAHRLAGWYREGEEGLHQSLELAFRWGLRAAEGGHVHAQVNTACCYIEGLGVAVDDAAAVAWFEKAAERGDQEARYNLGVVLAKGKGTPQSFKLAAEWYQRAADRGHTSAMSNLGMLYNAGDGVEQDHARANTLYREAIDVDNNTCALFNLGLSYLEGTGVEQSVATALSFWQRAGDLGHASAQCYVGSAYKEGKGGFAKNMQLARKYIKASAAQGDDKAVALLKEWNACAHCGTTPAAKVCKGCITTRYCRYCDAECQLAQWMGPAEAHRAHCGGRP